jgi:hypothetical protein
MHGPGIGGSGETVLDPATARLAPWPEPGNSAGLLVEKVLPLTPLAGEITRIQVTGSGLGKANYVVAIPVRNEEVLLPRALDALERSMARCANSAGAVVIVVNNSFDLSARLAAEWACRHDIAHVVVDADFEADVRNAPHARRLALDIAAAIAPGGALFTTDADSHVCEDWIEAGLARIASGADLLCEDVRLDETEAAQLPERVKLVGDIERAYFEASELLWRSWTGPEGGRFAYRASGASLVISAPAYVQAGRLPVPLSGEDRALCETMIRRGFRVEVNPDGGTRTSARLVARADGGCAMALVDRAQQPDPLCDSMLVPLPELKRRAQAACGQSCPRSTMEPTAGSMRFTQVLRDLADAIDLLEQSA